MLCPEYCAVKEFSLVVVVAVMTTGLLETPLSQPQNNFQFLSKSFVLKIKWVFMARILAAAPSGAPVGG